ncbi:hypothetical protein AK830_g9882 [Neonectria ditissima]|uniref:F-box domain-containing protein n=1 Tax=Neonectria ditissima TaxID=78410 RepID=A0A0N8H5N6_9HYPO|nr:hypothetical protein AK830_g9882 [Neonectria ditissima]
MVPKRKASVSCADEDGHHDFLQPKRPRLSPPMTAASHPPTRDILSTLSDELLVRILSLLGETTLLDLAPVSRRLRRLAADSQLWRAHYYTRFVLPRALRIPGFRVGTGTGTASPASRGPKLQYSARRAVWADGGWGRRGGLADVLDEPTTGRGGSIDWKRQYKLRHNWARGKCAVEEVSVRDASEGAAGQNRTLVKVVEGIAVTADSASGLRAWDLRTRQPIAQAQLQQDGVNDDDRNAPTSLAVDEQGHSGDLVDIAVGFADGGFGIWRLDAKTRQLTRRYRHERSCNGELVAVAYGHPYVLTATSAGLISLYTFNRPPAKPRGDGKEDVEERCGENTHDMAGKTTSKRMDGKLLELPPPYLLTSLTSHTTPQPIALSIRRMAASVSASIAYTFLTPTGWCIGVQAIHIEPSSSGADTLSSRLAYTLPINTGGNTNSNTNSNINNNNNNNNTNDDGTYPSPPHSSSSARSPRPSPPPPDDSQPLTTLCYSHPYLLATLPDNTLVLHLCTSTATSLSLSAGIRLWGHTSGISDAEITPRGKAVSISTRGDEIRVWELEGRVGGSSIEVRPRQPADDVDDDGNGLSGPESSYGHENKAKTPGMDLAEWEDRRNWVGFDDEMVIVLKEARDGRESLMVYDFT